MRGTLGIVVVLTALTAFSLPRSTEATIFSVFADVAVSGDPGGSGVAQGYHLVTRSNVDSEHFDWNMAILGQLIKSSTTVNYCFGSAWILEAFSLTCHTGWLSPLCMNMAGWWTAVTTGEFGPEGGPPVVTLYGYATPTELVCCG